MVREPFRGSTHVWEEEIGLGVPRCGGRSGKGEDNRHPSGECLELRKNTGRRFCLVEGRPSGDEAPCSEEREAQEIGGREKIGTVEKKVLVQSLSGVLFKEGTGKSLKKREKKRESKGT